MDKNKKKSPYKKVKLKFNYPTDLASNFVTNIVIQHQPDYFVLSFFEVWPPPILGETKKEKEDCINEVEHVEAKCVSRLVITPEKLREFIRVMSGNLSDYDKLAMLDQKLSKEE